LTRGRLLFPGRSAPWRRRHRKIHLRSKGIEAARRLFGIHGQLTPRCGLGDGFLELPQDLGRNRIIRKPPVCGHDTRRRQNVFGYRFISRISQIEFSRQLDCEIAFTHQWLGYRGGLLILR